MIPRIVSLAMVALLGVTSAAAEPPQTVDTIVANYVAARGGMEKLRSIQTLRQYGHAVAGADRYAIVTRELKRPGRIRFEFTVQGITSVYVSNGQQGWQVSPIEGDMEVTPLPDDVVQEALDQADIEGPLVDWKAKGHQVALVGRETVAGRETHKLKLTLKGGGVRYEYIDVNSFQEVRMDSTRQVRGKPVQLETTLGDFRKTGGILFPHKIEVGTVGRPERISIVVDKLEVNLPLSDARFEMPAPPSAEKGAPKKE